MAKIEKTPLDLINEDLKKKAKTREQNIKYFATHREEWNTYQARYMRERRKSDAEFRERLNQSVRSYQKRKQLQSA